MMNAVVKARFARLRVPRSSLVARGAIAALVCTLTVLGVKPEVIGLTTTAGKALAAGQDQHRSAGGAEVSNRAAAVARAHQRRYAETQAPNPAAEARALPAAPIVILPEDTIGAGAMLRSQADREASPVRGALKNPTRRQAPARVQSRRFGMA